MGDEILKNEVRSVKKAWDREQKEKDMRRTKLIRLHYQHVKENKPLVLKL